MKAKCFVSKQTGANFMAVEKPRKKKQVKRKLAVKKVINQTFES